MKNKLFPFILIFVNLYNPVSIWLTLALNIIFAIFILVKGNKIIFPKTISLILFLSIIIFLWSVIISVSTNHFSQQMIGRNLRIVASTFFIGLIIYNSKINVPDFIKSLSIVILLHIILIYIQLVIPDIKEPIARIFNYDREDYFESGIRCLGLCGSFDFAGLVSIIGILLFSLKYKDTHKPFDLICFLLAVISVAFVSRLAMFFGFIAFIYGSIIIYKTSRRFVKFIFTVLFILSSFFWLNFAFPIITSSLSFFNGNSTENSVLQSEGNEYSYGQTDDDLVENHLIFPDNLNDLIFGQGLEIGVDTQYSSDIGYVKLIYSIGLFGLGLIILMYYKMYRNARYTDALQSDQSYKLLVRLFKFMIIIIFIFNFKLLLMYSRGIHDLVLISFYVIDKYKISNT
jgi:hypothetical protein